MEACDFCALDLEGFIVFTEVFRLSSNSFLNVESTLCGFFITIIEIVSLPKDADVVWESTKIEENFPKGSV